MSVLTTDVVLEGIRRDDVLTWIADPANHERMLDGAFDGMRVDGPGRFTIEVKAGPRTREMTYRFDRVDEEHGGRRVHVELGGRRTTGHLSYSLRTMKPAANTLVTLHADIDSGGVFGMLAEQMGLRERLEKGFRALLQNLHKAMARPG